MTPDEAQTKAEAFADAMLDAAGWDENDPEEELKAAADYRNGARDAWLVLHDFSPFG